MSTRFEGEARRAVAMPLGGIGTGHVAIGGDGRLRQWQLLGGPNHVGFVPGSFFALRVASVEPPLDIRRVLQSEPLGPPAVAPPSGTDHLQPPDTDPATATWPPFAVTSFTGAYPFARIDYDDPTVPLDVTLEACTPFVPLDPDASGMPLAAFRFGIRNPLPMRIHGWLVGSQQNAAGWDGATPIDGTRCPLYGGNVNRVVARDSGTAILMDNPSLADDDPRCGELALWTGAPASVLARSTSTAATLRFVEGLKLLRPTITDDWSDASIRAAVRETPSPLTQPTGPSPAGTTWNGALAAAFSLAPGEETTIEFVLAWRFPNRYVDFDQFGPRPQDRRNRLWLGNWYAGRFASALDAVDAYVDDREHLLGASRAWSTAVAAADLPAAVVDTLEAQPSLIRSPTTFRTEDGRFYGFEGALGESTLNWNGDVGGSCPTNCNHVWNYEQALSRLFPSLERSMRETELLATQRATGSIPHRVLLPLWLPQLTTHVGGPVEPALDGMLGAVLKTYREHRQGASLEWTELLWPNLLRLFEHVVERWDVEGTGVLSGIQPVTYDIALSGPNMFVGSLWLAALRALEELARELDPGRADDFAERFAAASTAYDELLWNGDYYAQPETQADHDFGAGCLSDQLFGQWWAHQLELGYLLPPDHVASALAAIVRHNLRSGFRDFDHGYRVFADEDDVGLLVCTWPRGGRPRVPVRYCDEVWTGVEYQVAAHCLFEGLEAEALAILAGVRGRYDGTRRNPYNEIECGDHYSRAMAGWSLLEAATGSSYDASRARLRVGTASSRYPFLAGSGWGEVVVAEGSLQVHCLGGRVEVEEVVVVDAAGGERSFRVGPVDEGATITLDLAAAD